MASSEFGPKDRDPGGLREQSPAPPQQHPYDAERAAASSGAAWAQSQNPPPAGQDSGYEAEPGDVHVVFRRCVQFIVDGFLAGLLTGLVYAAVFVPLFGAPSNVDLSASAGAADAPPAAFYWVALLLVFAYWVLVPTGAGGQTLGMKLLGVKVVRKQGGEASFGQHLVRWILLIVDGLLAGLVGLVVMLFSGRRRRLGDMAAGTLVVRKR